MRWLSDKNTKIYFLLLIYVLFVSQTKEVLAMSTESLGFFAQNWIVQDTYLGVEATVFAFFENLPLSKILDIAFLFTEFLSVVTLCDSMTTTIASITLKGEGLADEDPRDGLRSSGAL